VTEASDANGQDCHLTLLPEPLQQIQIIRAGREASIFGTTRAHGLHDSHHPQ
jgi:hypothetical protein